uniref:Uncharacterized protein n=1 Tax=Acrobeloides nanus TaxID=290746 RepID=A0A914C399_9BILA
MIKTDLTRFFKEVNSGFEWISSKFSHQELIKCLEIVPDSRLLCFGDAGGNIVLANAAKEDMEICICDKIESCHSAQICDICINPSGDLVASTSNEENVKVIQLDKKKRKFSYEPVTFPFAEKIRTIAFVEDERYGSNLLIAGGGRTIFVSDCITGKVVKKLLGHRANITKVTSVGGCQFVASYVDKTLRVWDIRVDEPVRTFDVLDIAQGHSGSTSHIDTSGGCLARVDQQGYIHCYQFQTGRFVSKHKAPDIPITVIQFGTPQRFLVTADKNGLSICDLNEIPARFKTKKVLEATEKITAIRWHPKPTEFFAIGDKTLFRLKLKNNNPSAIVENGSSTNGTHQH